MGIYKLCLMNIFVATVMTNYTFIILTGAGISSRNYIYVVLVLPSCVVVTNVIADWIIFFR